MSRLIDLDKFSDEERESLNDDLNIAIVTSHFFAGKKTEKKRMVQAFDVEGGDRALIPFAYARRRGLGHSPERKRVNRAATFSGELRPHQKSIHEEATQFLDKTGSCIIAAYPGCGKTCLSIKIACDLSLKTLIVVHRVLLVKQWVKSIEKFTDSKKIQILDKNTKSLDKEAMFCVSTPSQIIKRKRSFFNRVGFLIVDEAHCILAESLSKCMNRVTPDRVLGLSATPYRNDGLDVLFDLYFGKKNLVSRELHRDFEVRLVKTGFVPEIRKQASGKIDWSYILEQQAENTKRNEMIANAVMSEGKRKFLVLCKRKRQATLLMDMLKEKGENSVDCLMGSRNEFNKEARVLVSTVSKAGVGFDHPSLNALVLASDVQAYFLQYLGRVLRSEEVVPIVFDFLDDNRTLMRHYAERKKIYKKHGGTVKTMP